ncbi:TPA: hypothetical protein ACE8HC_002186, partial [Neisseria gonorrhoeae]
RPLSLWERARERATSRKACIGAVELLGKVAATWRMPPPRPAIAASPARHCRAGGNGGPGRRLRIAKNRCTMDKDKRARIE